MQRKAVTFALLILSLLALAAAPAPQRSVAYWRYDVEIDIQTDGSLIVAETYELRFQGEFHTGFAEIPLDNVTEILDVQVLEGDETYASDSTGPGTYSLDRGYDAIRVDWEYEPTSGTETRVFTVKYRAVGALWVYPDLDWLEWKAVPADRSGIPTASSRVTVRLPAPVQAERLITRSRGVDAFIEAVDDRTVVFESTDPLPDGTAFEVEVGFPHGLTEARVTDWQRRADEATTSYRWTDLAVDLTVGADGSLDINETHTLAVDVGNLYTGYRSIPWLYLDRITDVTVQSPERRFQLSDTPCEFCYVVEEKSGREDWVFFDGERVIIESDQAGSTLVEWAFPPIGGGESGSFEVTYTALGAIRILSETQEINWTVIFADRDAPVEAATVTINLPTGLTAQAVKISGGTTTLLADGSVRVSHEGPVPARQSWSVSIQMPSNATRAAKPIWQGQLERALQEEEAHIEAARQRSVRLARWQVALGALGCLLPVLGLAGVIGAWYVWGRDQAAPPVASYLREPPSDLPPGIVAYLVDERPTVKGVLADLLHLATLGLISVDLRESDFTVQLNWTEPIEEDEAVRVADGEPIELAEHETTLFNLLLDRIRESGAGGEGNETATRQPVPFSEIREAFQRHLPLIYEQMGQRASRYFSILPATARRRWRWAGQIIVLAAGGISVAGLCGMMSLGWPACAPPVGLALVGFIFMGVSRWMPQRTTLGIEEAARWRAFRRYLRNLKRFGDLEAAQAILDRHFPYAVALDVDEIVLQQTDEMDAQLPIWMVPVPVNVGRPHAEIKQRPLRDRVAGGLRPPRPASGSPRTATARPSLSERPAGADVSLQGLSDSLSRSLNSASRSLSSVLNTAVGELDDARSPFEVAARGVGKATAWSWEAGTTTMKILGDILDESASGGGGGGFSGGGFRSSSWSSGGSSFRSSSSRSSGGGGSRGVG